MKKTLLRLSLLLCFCSVGSVKAQWVSIPDTNFGTWLNTYGYSTCLQGNNTVGWEMDTTCNAVISATSIQCYLQNIKDISGVQYFDNLLNLYCSYNRLDSLPSLPSSLLFLNCMHNQLTHLTNLPGSLLRVLCQSNQLTSLPDLPSSLTILYCSNNALSSLPTLPQSLLYFGCDSNQLTSLPDLPDSLVSFYCNDNSSLDCLPELKKIENFYFQNTGITCLPNYPQSNTFSNPPIESVPLCDILNPNGCKISWNISGKIYFDTILNCIPDLGERIFKNLNLRLYENGIFQKQTNSVGGGNYSFNTDLSTYQYSIDTSILPFTVVCPNNGYYNSVITASDSLDTDMNFAFRCKPGFDLVGQSIEGRFRPGNTRQVNISGGDLTNFYGTRCASMVSGSVQLVISGSATYVSPASGALTPTNASADTVTWNIPDFGAVNFFSDFNIMAHTDTNAQIGSQVCFSLVINPIAGDNNPSNNALDYCGVVVGSFDPNEKEVYPSGNIDTAQKWLTYTIHFQNTGTAEAQHIYVTDTLDSNVDAASFQLLAYSHQPMVQIKENAVRFNFPNINLPDSNTNEPLSHGYVQYKVKLKDNLAVGTNINNTAFIYFDFNSAVVTNTVSNTISTVTNVAEFGMRNLEFRMNPNPASSSVNISVDERMIGSNLSVYDVTGRKMAAVQLKTLNYKLETSAFSSGVYFVTVENERSSVTKKLIINR